MASQGNNKSIETPLDSDDNENKVSLHQCDTLIWQYTPKNGTKLIYRLPFYDQQVLDNYYNHVINKSDDKKKNIKKIHKMDDAKETDTKETDAKDLKKETDTKKTDAKDFKKDDVHKVQKKNDDSNQTSHESTQSEAPHDN